MLPHSTHAHQCLHTHTHTHKQTNAHAITHAHVSTNSLTHAHPHERAQKRDTDPYMREQPQTILSLAGPALSRKNMTERCTADTESCSCEDDASVKGTDYSALIFHSCMYVVSVHPRNTIKCAWSNERIDISKFCLTTE